MCLEMCFGTPPTCRKLVIHGQSFYSWVVDIYNTESGVPNERRFNLLNTSTIEVNRTQLTLTYEDEKYVTGFTGKDDITINNKKIFRQKFLITTNSSVFSGYEGMIGLGYMANSFERGYSFIDQLYNNRIIPHKVFTQSFHTSDKGEISFGEIPKNIVNDYKNYGRCPVLDKIIDDKKIKNRKWECQINGIYFGDEYNENKVEKYENSRVSFFSFRPMALIPKNVFDYFEKNYFQKYINDGVCQKFNTQGYDVLGCKKILDDAQKINLIYGDWVMSLPPNKLFSYKKNNELYEFIFYHKNNFESWSLGRPIVRLFHMIYDYQNQEVGFYSKEYVKYINKENEPMKPKIYEPLPDSEIGVNDNDELDEQNRNENKNKKNVNDIIEEIKKDSGITKDSKSRTMKGAELIQKMFYGFLIIISILILLFIAFLYYRYKNRPENLSSEYFIKKANELSYNIN